MSRTERDNWTGGFSSFLFYALHIIFFPVWSALPLQFFSSSVDRLLNQKRQNGRILSSKIASGVDWGWNWSVVDVFICRDHTPRRIDTLDSSILWGRGSLSARLCLAPPWAWLLLHSLSTLLVTLQERGSRLGYYGVSFSSAANPQWDTW